jgi:hypothetical protein
VYQDSGDGTADMSKWKYSLPSFHMGYYFDEERHPVRNRNNHVRTTELVGSFFFGSLQRISRLAIHLPTFSARWDQGELHAATCIDIKHMEQVFEVLKAELRSQPGASHLSDLTLKVPMTSHVVQVLEGLNEGDAESLPRLCHLQL